MRYLIDRVKAWWRGDRRVAPTEVRGRVYARPDATPIEAEARPEATIRARVIRADGRVENLGVIARGRVERQKE